MEKLLTRRNFIRGALGLGIGVGVGLSGIRVTEQGLPILGERKVITIGHRDVLAAGVADYVCNGVDDNVQLQAALDALPSIGGKLVVLAGTYNFTATVSRAVDDVVIQGVGFGTLFNNDGATALFSAGSRDGWVFRDFATDVGGLDYATATNTTLENIMEGTTYWGLYPHETILDAHTRDIRQIVRINKYYMPGRTGRFETNAVVGANKIIASPFLVTRPMTVDRIAVEIQTAGGGGAKLMLGIYEDDGTVNPDNANLVVDGGEVDVTGTGLKTATISEALEKGLYWVVAASNDGTTKVYSGLLYENIVGIEGNLKWPMGSTTATLTYPASLPATHPASSGLLTYMWSLALRVASLD